jgi:hypothetical protein
MRRRRLLASDIIGSDMNLSAPIAPPPALRLPLLTALVAGPILLVGPRS